MTGTDNRFAIVMEMDKQNIIRSLRVEQSQKTKSLGYIVCSEVTPTEDSFRFILSFDPKCKFNHFSVRNIKNLLI